MQRINDHHEWAVKIVKMVLWTTALILAFVALGEYLAVGRVLNGNILTQILVFGMATGFFIVKKTNQYHAVATILFTYAIYLVLYRVVHTGGFHSPLMCYVPIIPIMSFYIFSRKYAFAMTGLVLMMVGFIGFYDTVIGINQVEFYMFNGILGNIHVFASVLIISSFGYIFDVRTKEFQDSLESTIDELKDVTFDLEATKQNLYFMISKLPAAVCMLDKHQNYLSTSSEWKNLLGQDYDVLGTNLFASDNQFTQYWKEVFFRLKMVGQSLSGEDEVPMPNGEFRWLKWNLRFDKSSREEFYIFSIEDITEMKNSQLIVNHSARMTALGEMAGGIAHEINNPLSIISGYSTIISKELMTTDLEKSKKYIGKVQDTIKRISKIINGMKNFSRDTSEDIFEKSNIKSVVDNTLDLCYERLKNNNILIKLDYDDFFVKGKSMELVQVLSNLVTNSFHAIKKSSDPWIEIEVLKVDTNIQIRVTDSGDGIPASQIPKLFAPFYTTKDIGEGTGLGLSIVKGIVESHNGSITYCGHKGHTSFIITLPEFDESSEKAA